MITRNKIRDHFRREATQPVVRGGTEFREEIENLPDPHDDVSPDSDSAASDEVRGVASRIPGLGDVPVLGALFRSVEYRRLTRLQETMDKLGEPPLFVVHAKGEEKLSSRQSLLNHLMEAGKKGLSIQRYKGLGEMNPDQLWETTMDPERRRVLEVRIEDAAEADRLFSILMGDAVEPRRQFIEENALDVRNLDV